MLERPQSLASSLYLFGFGAQGSAEAINLRRSGVAFTLVLREKTESWTKALMAGFKPMAFSDLPESLSGASVALNLPDQIQADVYTQWIAPRNPDRLIFAHGFNTHFKRIPIRPSGPAHVLVAPKGAASGLIEFYGTTSALPCILAIEGPQNESNEKAFAEDYAKAIGCHSSGLIWASFKDETECDLFSEQVLLCGGVSSLLRMTYECLIESGYHPEAAYFETLFELKLIVDLLWRNGITGMRSKISPTARYGDITRGDRLIDDSVKKRMKEILGEVQSGVFAKEFLDHYPAGRHLAMEKSQERHPLEIIGKTLREKLKHI